MKRSSSFLTALFAAGVLACAPQHDEAPGTQDGSQPEPECVGHHRNVRGVVRGALVPPGSDRTVYYIELLEGIPDFGSCNGNAGGDPSAREDQSLPLVEAQILPLVLDAPLAAELESNPNTGATLTFDLQVDWDRDPWPRITRLANEPSGL